MARVLICIGCKSHFEQQLNEEKCSECLKWEGILADAAFLPPDDPPPAPAPSQRRRRTGSRKGAPRA